MKKRSLILSFLLFLGIAGLIRPIQAEAEEMARVNFRSGEVFGTTYSITVPNGSEITLPDAYWSSAKYTFVGWNNTNWLNPDNIAGPQYKKGDKVKVHGYDQFVAQWVPTEIYTYTVKFHGNGGKGRIKERTEYVNKKMYLGGCQPTREGYIFLGWSTNRKAKKPQYTTYYTGNKNTTLYAVWQWKYRVTFKKGKKKDTITIKWRRTPGAYKSRVYVSKSKTYSKNTYMLVTKSKKSIITKTFSMKKGKLKGYRYVWVTHERKNGKYIHIGSEFQTRIKCR